MELVWQPAARRNGVADRLPLLLRVSDVAPGKVQGGRMMM